MGIVSKGFLLPRERACRIMYQEVAAAILAHSLKESLCCGVEVNDRHLFTFCHCLHSSREVTVGITHSTVLLKETALCRRTEDDVTALITHTVNESLQRHAVMIPCSTARTLLFLIIMTELAEHIVTLLYLTEYLVKTQLRKERGGSKTALAVVSHTHLVSKPTREHLSP